MRHITAAVERLEATANDRDNKQKPDSLVETILRQYNDPKLAAVLALDLLLVGVDTVFSLKIEFSRKQKIFIVIDQLLKYHIQSFSNSTV